MATTQDNQLTKQGDTAVVRQDSNGSRWSVWDEMSTLRQQVDDLFGRAFGFGPITNFATPNLPTINEPLVDIFESDTEIKAAANVPGYTSDNLQIEATEGRIYIHGEREGLVDDKLVPHQKNGVTQSSRFSIAFSLPAAINPSGVSASLENGVLNLVMPKAEPRNNKVKVPLKAA